MPKPKKGLKREEDDLTSLKKMIQWPKQSFMQLTEVLQRFEVYSTLIKEENDFSNSSLEQRNTEEPCLRLFENAEAAHAELIIY